MSEARYLIGDVFERLADIPDQSVHSVITSPPYWRKRRYLPVDHPDAAKEIGQEPSPGEFLATLLRLTDDLWRVVRDDGTIWVNLGDTASGSGGAGGDYNEGGKRDGQARYIGSGKGGGIGATRVVRDEGNTYVAPGDGMPLRKSVCWIPELFGASLAYGRNLLTGQPCRQWITRPQITWCKPAPTPGEIIDKFREATELIVWASKNPKYYFDLDAVREPHKADTSAQAGAPRSTPRQWTGAPVVRAADERGVPPLNWWKINSSSYNGWTTTARRVPCGPDDGGERTTSSDCPTHGDRADQAPTEPRDGHAAARPDREHRTSRNGSDHDPERLDGFAPTHLPHDGSSEEPAPSQERARAANPRSTGTHRTALAPSTTQPCMPSAGTLGRTARTPTSPSSAGPHLGTIESSTASGDSPASPELRSDARTDGSPSDVLVSSCSCSFSRVIDESTSHFATFPPELIVKPVIVSCPPGGTILDPFGGSGVTAMVATGNGRNCISIDIDARNLDLARERIGMFLIEDETIGAAS